MIRRYCDYCGNLINENNTCENLDGPSNRLKAEVLNSNSGCRVQVEVHVAKDTTWNTGDFCKYCVIDAIKKLDDRPDIGE